MNYLIPIVFHFSNFFLFSFLWYWSGHYLNEFFAIPKPYNIGIAFLACAFLAYKIYQFYRINRPIFNDIDYENDESNGITKGKTHWINWFIPILLLIVSGLFSLAQSPEIKNVKKINKKIMADKIKLEKAKNIQWKKIGESKNSELFIEPTKYTLPIPLRKITILLNSTGSFKINNKEAKSTVADVEIDCSLNNYRVINKKSFSKKNGLGINLSSNSKVKEWKIIKKLSSIKNVKNYVCKKIN